MIKIPVPFSNRMKKLLGAEYSAFADVLQGPPPVSVRLNPAKRINDFDRLVPVPWASDAYYLSERKSFTLDPLFHAGCYYVQEASSMILEKVLKQVADIKPVKVLDLCAAPGGKSTHLLSTLPGGSLIVSNEVVPSRNVILQQNLTRWGFAETVVTQNDAADFSRLKNYFDIILVDAPCSGEGLFRKQPDAVNEWSEEAVKHCSVRQKQILKNILPALKTDGYLIYSTCTFEPEENEEQIKWMQHNFHLTPVKILNNDKDIVESDYGLRMYPHRIKGEGFFISLLRKNDTGENAFKGKKQEIKNEKFSFHDYLNNADDFECYRNQNEIYAFPVSLWNDIHLLKENLFVRKAGIHVGSLKGKDFVPSQELAMSNDLHDDVQRTDLTLEESLHFLKCESIMPARYHQGWSVACFKGFTLGWMKGIGKRINNYYPRAQRILMAVQ